MSIPGRRVIITGSTGSGKSRLGAELAERLGVPFVELDALFWEPEWTPAEDELFRERVCAATRGDAWVVTGNYFGRTRDLTWPRAETVVYLDFPLALIWWRVVRRSWRRWRSKELLWGTNYERFWTHFTDRERSLLVWAWTTRRTLATRWLSVTTDPSYMGTRFVRLRSPGEASAWLDAVAPRGGGTPGTNA